MVAKTAMHRAMREAVRSALPRCRPSCCRRGTPRSSSGLAALVVGSVLLGALAGCGSDSTGPARSSTYFRALHFDWTAVTMALDSAKYDTVRLTATPVTQTGVPLLGAGPVRYTAVDSNVTIDSTGLVTAHYQTSQTIVVASLTVNGVTHVDTARIMVTQDPAIPAPLKTFSIQPVAGDLDSAKIALDKYYKVNQFNGNIPLYATDSLGDNLCDVYGDCPFLVAFGSSDPRVATLDPSYGYLSANFVGKTTFTASALVDGVGKRDSLPFTIGYNLVWGIPVYPGGTPSHVTPLLIQSTSIIGVGGFVRISNYTSQPMEVVVPYQTPMVHRVFSTKTQLTDTLVVGDFYDANAMIVQFDSAGTYTFRTTLLGSGATTTGTVIVSPGP